MLGTGSATGPHEDRPHVRPTVLRRLNRWQAEAQREDLADLFVECCPAAPGQEFRTREAFLARLVKDARRPGFDMLVAETASLTGLVLGTPLKREGSWWKGFIGVLPQNVEQLTASGHVFAITDLAVHPYAREHGVAHDLQERLLADNQASLGATLVDGADHEAYAAFQSWGWQEIGELRRTPAPDPMRVLVLPVGRRDAIVPGGLVHNPHTQRPPVS